MPPATPSPAPEQLARDRRVLSIIWRAVMFGVVLLAGVMIYLVTTSTAARAVAGASLFFYLNAVLSLGAIAGAFAVQRGLEARLPTAGTYAEASALIRQRVILSAAVIEGSALVAAVAYFVTGEALNLAFLVPFFAFMLLFRPTEARYRGWLARWRGQQV